MFDRKAIPMRITQIHPHFVGEVTDLDLSKGLSEDMFVEVRAAIEEKAVLVFRNQQALDDDAQIAFSTRFGDLQKSITVHREDTVRRLKRPELSGRVSHGKGARGRFS